MKNSIVITVAGLFVFTSLASATQTNGAWWDTGITVLESVIEPSTVETLAGPSVAEMGEAFKEALQIGSENVVKQLGNIDGFNSDPAIHIPLPEELKTVKTMLSKIGMSQSVDDLELKLNRAAEAATPEAKKLFIQSIKDMTFEDVKAIYEGPEDSATRYFQSQMTPALIEEMRPIVDNSLAQVGALQVYDNVIGQYKTLPFVPDVKANLSAHVIQKGMDGIFLYIAKEEAEIRKNPVKQTTALLKKVFGPQ